MLNPAANELTISKPDDWHLHVRDSDMLHTVLAHSARRFGRAIVMPNLHPPVCTVDQAVDYRSRIMAALPEGSSFTPLMTLYLNDAFDVQEVRRASESGAVTGVKLYPKGIAMKGQPGVSAIRQCYPILEAMQKHDLPLLVHGEVTDTQVDIFDRERTFIDDTLAPIVRQFPDLRIVLEHISTAEAVQFIQSAPANVAATITAHHLLLNRNSIFEGGIRPHHYCIPVLKREDHRQAILAAATSGNPKFFLGTDSAPHARSAKEAACGCAGVYTAHAAIELYAEVFEQANALEKLEGFASHFGADFYRLDRNREFIRMVKKTWQVPQYFDIGSSEKLVPFRAGDAVHWQLAQP